MGSDKGWRVNSIFVNNAGDSVVLVGTGELFEFENLFLTLGGLELNYDVMDGRMHWAMKQMKSGGNASCIIPHSVRAHGMLCRKAKERMITSVCWHGAVS